MTFLQDECAYRRAEEDDTHHRRVSIVNTPHASSCTMAVGVSDAAPPTGVTHATVSCVVESGRPVGPKRQSTTSRGSGDV